MSEGGQQARRAKQKMEKVLGEYRILAELARGGMGRVYVARRNGQAGFERYFAIKVMHQQLNDDQKWVMMLLDEAHIASKLHHPNVVPVLDIGTFADGYYLVMDYVEGCSLQELLKKSPDHRPVKAIVSILLDSLRGLHAVHTLRGENDEELHVVHRDVSPHNLLLGVDGSCRVTDFGIAKAKQRFTDTDVGTHKGKIAFMAPEQMRGQTNLDGRADVWAAGVTLYEALTGVHPFRGENDAMTVHSVIGGEVALPSEVGLKPPAVFDDVIMRALRRDPNERYASAEQFADELRDAALQINALGSASDVAQWVKAVCGAQLAERRRKLAQIPKGAEDTIAGNTATLPKLWFNNEGGQTGEASGSVTRDSMPVVPGQTGWRAVGSSVAALASSRPRELTIGALLCIAALVAITTLLTRHFQSSPDPEVVEVDAPARPTAAEPPAAPAAVLPAEHPAQAPLAPTPAVSAESDEPKRAALVPSGSSVRRPAPRVSNTSKAHKNTSTPSAAANVAPPALPSAAPPAVEGAPAPAAPAPAPPARQTPKLDSNPYLLGE